MCSEKGQAKKHTQLETVVNSGRAGLYSVQFHTLILLCECIHERATYFFVLARD